MYVLFMFGNAIKNVCIFKAYETSFGLSDLNWNLEALSIWKIIDLSQYFTIYVSFVD